jgi:hypothetical protein
LEGKADSSSTEEDSVAGTFLFGESLDEAIDGNEETEDDGSFTSNGSGGDDNGNSSGNDSDISTAPPSKRRKTSGVHWW